MLKKTITALLGITISCSASVYANEPANNLQNWLSEFITPVHASKWDGEKPTQLVTALGTLKGAEFNGIKIFRGIKYAEAPVGEKRFAPPVQTTAWEGIKDATNFGHMCYQGGKGDFSEDCLFLNIWTPAKRAQEKLPVYIFIHGGGFGMDAGSQPLYEGTQIAKSGVVVVTLNYRLGTLGFLPSKAAFEKYGTTGNWGLLDMITALEWVNKNIASFGGDPARITIGGESAGAYAVSALINSPKAKGLFQQAIMESGSLPTATAVAPFTALSLQQANVESGHYFSQFGFKDNDAGLAALRNVPAEKIMATNLKYEQLRMPQVGGFWPVPDGFVYKSKPVEQIRNGNINQVKLLAGFNTDEGSLFIPPTTNENDYKTLIESAFGENANKVLKRYPISKEHNVTERMNNIITLGLLRSGMYQYADSLAKQNDVYMYHFDFSDPMIKPTGLGVIHGSEIKYIFHNFMTAVNKQPEAKNIATLMQTTWINFIKTGNPNRGNQLPGEVKWDKYNPGSPTELHISETSAMQPIYHAEDVRFINRMLPHQH